MQKIYSTLFLLVILFAAKANDSTINLVVEKQITGDFRDFEVDNLSNIYIITPTNQIKKYNSNFDSLAVYNNPKLLGNISTIDVSNPLKILIFYKGFSTIVVLDRFLTILNTIELQKQNLFTASTVTSSYDNNIWLFDEVENKVKKIDNEGKVLSSSIDFRLLFDFENAYTAEYLKEFEGKLYLYNKQNGLLIFDYYGGLQNRLPLKGLSNVQLFTNKLLGTNNKGKIEIQDEKKYTSQKINCNIDLSDAVKITLRNNFVYCLNKTGMVVYKMSY